MLVAAFVAGVLFTALLSAGTVLLLIKLDLLRKHGTEEEIKARLETSMTLTDGRCKASEDWMRGQVEDVRAAILNLTAHVEKLHRTVNASDQGGYTGEPIPKDMEIIGAVEGIGND